MSLDKVYGAIYSSGYVDVGETTDEREEENEEDIITPPAASVSTTTPPNPTRLPVVPVLTPPPLHIPPPQPPSVIEPSPVSLLSTTSGVKDWNAEFQRLIESEDTEEKFRKLSHLAHDFVNVATTYAKIIISEMCLPEESKSIKPIAVGGVAGGQKFILQNILFKFALDVRIKSGWMYGGDAPSDENAMKAGSHELRACAHYFSCHISGLHVPLIALINFKGFRLIAISLLPIRGRDTIVYGSCDSGRTVHCSHAEHNCKMAQAAALLNLRGHLTGLSGSARELHACGDIEGHVGTDQRYYIIDFARTFPAEAPESSPSEPRAVFYKLLRPELVRTNPVPLSSDAFTAWGRHDPNFAVWNEDVRQATARLLHQIIPDFSRQLDAQPATPTPAALVEAMHRVGINVRHIGKVRHHVTTPEVRNVLLVEMVARVIKNLLRERLRAKMREERLLSDEPFKQVVIDTFNAVLGKSPLEPAPNSPSASSPHPTASVSFWSDIRQRVLAKFGADSLNADERDGSPELFAPGRGWFGMKALFERLLTLCGVRLHPLAERELLLDPHGFEFVDSDVDDLIPRVKHMEIVSQAEGMSLSLRARRMPPGRRERARLLSLASTKFSAALAAAPASYKTMFHWGWVFRERAAGHVADAKAATELLEAAVARFEASVKIQGDFVEGLLALGDTLVELVRRRRDVDKPALDAIVATYRRAFAAAPADATWGGTPWEVVHKLSEDLYKHYHATKLTGRGHHVLFVASETCRLVAEHPAVPRGKTVEARLLWAAVLIELGRGTFREKEDEREGYFRAAAAQLAAAAREARQFAETTPQAVEATGLVRGTLAAILRRARELYDEARTIDKSMHYAASELFAVAMATDHDGHLHSDAATVAAWAGSLWEYATIVARPELLEGAGIRFQEALLLHSGLLDDRIATAFGRADRRTTAASPAVAKATMVDLLRLSAYCPRLFDRIAPHWAALRTIDLEGVNPMPDGNAVERLAAMATSLTTLRLGSSAVTDNVLLAFARAAAGRLRQLDLTNCKAVTDDAVATLLHTCTGLVWLSLRGCGEATTEHLVARDAVFSATLRHLDLSDCQQLTYFAVRQLTMTLTSLESLILDKCSKVTDEAVALIAKKLTNLKKLSLARCSRLTKEIAPALASGGLRQLESLSLRCIKLTDIAAMELARISTLTALDLYETPLSSKALAHFAEHLTALTSLNLKDFKRIADATFIALATLPRMKYLDVENCRLSSTAFLGLTAKLRTAPSPAALVSLNLARNNDLMDEALEPLFEYLPSLSFLNLCGCADIADGAVISAAMHCPQLTTVLLGRCNRVTAKSIALLARQCPHLQRLLLDYCNVTEDAAQVIYEHCHELRSLSLGNCVLLTSGSIVRMCRAQEGTPPFAAQLIGLQLPSCPKLTDECITVLANVATSLQSLDVSYCPITDVSVMHVAEHLSFSLRELNLAHCKRITDRSIIQLIKYVPLQALDLQGVSALTDAAVVAIAKRGYCLRTLNLNECTRLTEESLNLLRKMRPNVKLVLASHNPGLMSELKETLNAWFATVPPSPSVRASPASNNHK